MTGNNANNKSQDQRKDCRFDEDYDSGFLQGVEKANELVGNIIRKDGVDYGRIVEITTITTGYSVKHIAVTDKGYRIDAGSILRLIAQSSGSTKYYPDGTSYSVSAMRSPKRKGSGQAMTGNSVSNSLNKKGVK